MRLPEEGDRPLTLNLVPMIDVLFSILAFFILSTLFLVPSEGLDVNLPVAKTAEEQAQTAFKVGIDATGTIYFQQQEIALEDLVIILQKGISNRNNLVVIQADENVKHGRVVEIMDQLRNIEGIKLAIATIAPATTPPQ